MVISCRPEGETDSTPNGVRNDVCMFYKSQQNDVPLFLSSEMQNDLYWWDPSYDSSVVRTAQGACASFDEFETAAGSANSMYKPVYVDGVLDEDNSQPYLTARSHMR